MKEEAALINNHLRATIYSYRKASGLSQESMASILHVSPRSYCEQERGKYGFSILSLIYFMAATMSERTTILFLKELYAFLKGIK